MTGTRPHSAALLARNFLAASTVLWAGVAPAALMVEDERRAAELTESLSSTLPELGFERGQAALSLDAVVKRLRAGDLEGAEQLARETVKVHPRDAAAHELLGVTLGLRAQPKEALAALQTAIKLAPTRSSAITKAGSLLLAMDRNDEAIEHFERALRIDPADRFAHQRMGLIREARNEIPAAISHFEKGLTGTPPGYIGVKINLGRLYNLSGRFEDTVALLDGLAEQARGAELNANVVLGTAYLRLGKTQEALARFNKAATAEPGNAGYQLARGIALRDTGDGAGSLAALERALKLAPDNIEAQFQRIETLIALDRRPQAIDALHALAAANHQPLRAKSRLAELLLDAQDAAAAAAILRELAAETGAPRPIVTRWLAAAQASGDLAAATTAAELLQQRYPTDPVAHFEAGRYFAFATQYERAEAASRAALKLKPDDAETLYLLAAIESRQGKLKASVDTARRLMKLSPDSIRNRFLLASLLQANDQAKAAEAEYRNILERAPEHGLALNNLAHMLAERGRTDEALPLAEQARKALPDNGMVLDTLGWIQHKLGRHGDAVATLTTASTLAPTQGAVFYHLGLAQQAAGRHPDARLALQKALELAPQADWASDARTRLDKAPR